MYRTTVRGMYCCDILTPQDAVQNINDHDWAKQAATTAEGRLPSRRPGVDAAEGSGRVVETPNVWSRGCSRGRRFLHVARAQADATGPSFGMSADHVHGFGRFKALGRMASR